MPTKCRNNVQFVVESLQQKKMFLYEMMNKYMMKLNSGVKTTLRDVSQASIGEHI